ncbi:MAG TPA: hypothetical protein VMM13_04520, partial [Euzebya sp.]|nr:hypothetical protein [Euzebya sp.]
MTTPHVPTDDQLAAWLAGDLDAPDDRAVTAAVRTDPAVAARADVLAAVMAQLAGIADTPGPPPAPVEAILAAATAAAATPPSAGGAMPLAAPAGAG